MRLPWQKTEKRESQPFTDAVAEALVEAAGGNVNADVKETAALETAAGLWARAFAAARLSPRH